MITFEELTKIQRDHMNNDLFNENRDKIQNSWFDETTVDFWRHDRFYQLIEPLARFYKNNSWLSVGDGRFGLDSVRLKKKFALNVFPTDISENMLKRGKDMGLFDEYGVENVENLSFEDDSYDVIFCKESMHHFPRPMIGLYEMIRVAKEAVIIIEPIDEPKQYLIDNRKYFKSAMKLLIGKLLGKKVQAYLPYQSNFYDVHGIFEPSGNYIYELSNREVNKVVHALDLGGMAFIKMNDVYLEGVEYEQATSGNPTFEKIKELLKFADETGNFNVTATVIFKNKIPNDLRKMMEIFGYTFPKKTDNPHINS